ncbi:MAG: hypothetical protein HY868_21160 [Chloroflexi bacterium]|nr:hypothetical protein [Chloroflexota bacterium]
MIKEETDSGLDIPREWLEEFQAAARRPLALRMRYAFIHTYKPVLDDASYRSFDTMEEYRRWCEKNVTTQPSFLYPRITRIFANFFFLFAQFALFADKFVFSSA